MKLTRCTILLTLVLPASCATSFTGSAHVANGRSGCEAKCSADGLEFAGMVYMGEYSSACVCAVPGESAAARRQLLGATSTTAGAVGVVMQQRRQQQQNSGGGSPP